VSLLVVGSIALDSVRTPNGDRENALGGSATYFCTAASFFCDTRLVGVVGGDFPEEHRRYLEGRRADCAGLVVEEEGLTFRWSGVYEGDMSHAQTLSTELNVLGTFRPRLPESFRDSGYVFLANAGPALQKDVKDQLTGPRLVVADTMNLWIDTALEDLKALLKEIGGFVLNDAEARQLTGIQNLAKAARAIVAAGPEFVIIKKGEHGAMLLYEDEFFVAPAYPTENVVDPTGAGDSFAGGTMGYLAACGTVDKATLRRAILRGTAVASFAVQGFSVEGLCAADADAVEARVSELVRMLSVEG